MVIFKMSVINDYVNSFIKNEIESANIRDRLQKTLEAMVGNAGIMAYVSTRMKTPERLIEKIRKKDQDYHFNSFEEIERSIPDLVGGRIALYFPNDRDRIKTLLESEFVIETIKEFPKEQQVYLNYERRFPGYSAIHYRVRFKNNNSKINPLLEIQVASLLMHAWSEVEHDLAYKKKQGDVSYEEYETLDEINGLVIAGEISLQRLQRITQKRVLSEKKGFETHYQLGQYLYDKTKSSGDGSSNDIGDVESLFKLYEKEGRLSKAKIDNDLKKIDFQSLTPISEQLIDLNSGKSLSNTQFIIKNKANKAINESSIDDVMLGSFVKNWIKLEKELDKTINKPLSQRWNTNERIFQIARIVGSDISVDEYKKLRKIRNEIVHGLTIPDSTDLRRYTERITFYYNLVRNYNLNHTNN